MRRQLSETRNFFNRDVGSLRARHIWKVCDARAPWGGRSRRPLAARAAHRVGARRRPPLAHAATRARCEEAHGCAAIWTHGGALCPGMRSCVWPGTASSARPVHRPASRPRSGGRNPQARLRRAAHVRRPPPSCAKCSRGRSSPQPARMRDRSTRTQRATASAPRASHAPRNGAHRQACVDTGGRKTARLETEKSQAASVAPHTRHQHQTKARIWASIHLVRRMGRCRPRLKMPHWTHGECSWFGDRVNDAQRATLLSHKLT